MAEEAYRAVFLRVHPTGKIVLSLTTESDGNEREYAELVARGFRVPPLDVKVVGADTDRFGVGHGFNTSPSEGATAAIVSAGGKIREKARLLAGAALGVDPATLTPVKGAGRTATAATRRRSRRSRTSRSTPTGRALCRRASRAGSTPRPSTGTRDGPRTPRGPRP